MLTQETTLTFRPTSIDELRRPHPEQKRIDADSAALFARHGPGCVPPPGGQPAVGRQPASPGPHRLTSVSFAK